MKTMKIFRTMLLGVAAFLAASCEEGIDPINRVEPGPDEVAPTVTINYPGQGTLIRVKEDVAPINIDFVVVDDIEIGSISVSLDGTKIKDFTSFKDYRRALQNYQYDQLTNGTHTLAITATDLSGKSTTETVTFEKVAPYQPVYAG